MQKPQTSQISPSQIVSVLVGWLIDGLIRETEIDDDELIHTHSLPGQRNRILGQPVRDGEKHPSIELVPVGIERAVFRISAPCLAFQILDPLGDVLSSDHTTDIHSLDLHLFNVSRPIGLTDLRHASSRADRASRRDGYERRRTYAGSAALGDGCGSGCAPDASGRMPWPTAPRTENCEDVNPCPCRLYPVTGPLES